MANDEERDSGVLLSLGPALADDGVCVLGEAGHLHPLPLAVPVTDVVVTKHQQASPPPLLHQAAVVGDEMFSVPVTITSPLSGLTALRAYP